MLSEEILGAACRHERDAGMLKSLVSEVRAAEVRLCELEAERRDETTASAEMEENFKSQPFLINKL